MIVVVGMLCEGGVIIGTDSAATLGNPLLRTIEQPTRKIDIVDDSVIVAGTGEIGLHQRFVAVVERLQGERVFKDVGTSHVEVGKRLAVEAQNDFASTNAFKQRQDATGVSRWFDYGALVAFWKHGKGHLVELGTGTLQPEFKDDGGLWHVSMGSGMSIADPFLGMMRRAFCVTSTPKLAIGRFIVCWTLVHTIELNTGGIGGPPAIAVLSKEGGTPAAKMISEEQLQEHLAMVDLAYGHLSEFPTSIESAAGEIPS